MPEKLIYELTWTGIKAGTAMLEITDNKETTKIVSTARSADWVSVFYTVDDRIESVLGKPQVKASFGFPRSYRVKIREGRHRRDKEVIFDGSLRKAFFTDNISGEKKEVDIPDSIFDPLSSLYYMRTLAVEVGKPVFIDIFDSKRLWNVEVQILRKEKISTKLGSFDTIVVKPLMRSEGIFNRRGDMYIWLTDDQKRIPVKMQTKVAVGSVTATLIGGDY
ncbi:MAG: DUF3108 domain-containing protein [Nitrospirae bacterium]|nr:DUF3108 domain-containing protein [Nitrospirota bacterium]